MSIFTKLLRKLTQECLFSINNRLIKQVDCCPMGGMYFHSFKYAKRMKI